MLKCPCGLAYIGQTSRALKVRISEHRSAIRRGDMDSPVARHFLERAHPISQLRFLGIELVPKPNRGGNFTEKLLRRELFWIYQLNTLSPRGLNEDRDFGGYR